MNRTRMRVHFREIMGKRVMSAMRVTRREAVAGIAAFASAWIGGSGRLLAEEPAPVAGMPRGLKLSCSSLAFSDLAWQKALEEIKKLGFRYADLAMFEGWCHVSPSMLSEPERHGRMIAEVCKKLGIVPIAIHANFNPNQAPKFPGLTTPDAAARAKILDQFERVAVCARTAGVPLVNVQPGAFVEKTPRKECLDRAAELLAKMVKIAGNRGLVLTFENHAGSIAQEPADALALLEAAPGLRLDYDPSHVVACSIPVERTIPLMKYVAHVGIRNAKAGSYNEPIREEKLSYALEPFLDAFRAAKVNAFVSVEYYEPRMREYLAPLKAILERAGVPNT